MPTTELYRDEFSTLSRVDEHRAIVLHWFPTTMTMSEAQFRVGLERLASTLEKERLPNVCIDVVKFGYKPQADFSAWRDKNIIPRYNAAGVKKFAFVVPAQSPHSVEHGVAPAAEPPGGFPTGYFNSAARADAWFDGSA
jgi:hypothetical protein